MHAFWENSMESLATDVAAAQTEGGYAHKRQMLATNVHSNYVL